MEKVDLSIDFLPPYSKNNFQTILADMSHRELCPIAVYGFEYDGNNLR